MTIALSDVGRSLNEADISAFERRFSIELPQEYRDFLLAHNGGRPEPDAFPIKGFEKNPKGVIHVFLRLDGAIESSNVDWTYRTMLGRIPKNLIAIARDGSGGLVCLSMSGPDRGVVYYWDFYGETCPPSWDNVFRVTDTFREFLDSIHYWNPLESADA